jgi:hypothetical protein
MPTKIVLDAGVTPVTALQDGVAATLRLLTAAELAGVSGVYFNGQHEAAPDPQAADADARERLRALSEELCRPFLGTR